MRKLLPRDNEFINKPHILKVILMHLYSVDLDGKSMHRKSCT